MAHHAHTLDHPPKPITQFLKTQSPRPPQYAYNPRPIIFDPRLLLLPAQVPHVPELARGDGLLDPEDEREQEADGADHDVGDAEEVVLPAEPRDSREDCVCGLV